MEASGERPDWRDAVLGERLITHREQSGGNWAPPVGESCDRCRAKSEAKDFVSKIVKPRIRRND
jgi:hypothetical protein